MGDQVIGIDVVEELQSNHESLEADHAKLEKEYEELKQAKKDADQKNSLMREKIRQLEADVSTANNQLRKVEEHDKCLMADLRDANRTVANLRKIMHLISEEILLSNDLY